MKQFALLFVLGVSFLTGVSLLPASAGTDYGLMAATPYNSEIALARARLEKFLYTANAKQRAVLARTPVVAIEAAVLRADETGPLLRRIEMGEFGRTGAYPADQAGRMVSFLLLFDSRTGQLVSDDGVLVLEAPQRGKVGIFEGVSALYIGKGW
jgi:hypothetical protein